MSAENSGFDYFMAFLAIIVVLFVIGFLGSAPSHVKSYIYDEVTNPESVASRNTHGTCTKCKALDVDLTDGLCINCWWP